MAEKEVDTRTTSEKRSSLNTYWKGVADSILKKKNSPEEELDSFEVKEKPRKKFFAKEREATTEEVTLTFGEKESGSFKKSFKGKLGKSLFGRREEPLGVEFNLELDNQQEEVVTVQITPEAEALAAVDPEVPFNQGFAQQAEEPVEPADQQHLLDDPEAEEDLFAEGNQEGGGPPDNPEDPNEPEEPQGDPEGEDQAMAQAAAAAALRRKELGNHFATVVEKFKKGVRTCSINDWLKRVDGAVDYLGMDYAEKTALTLQFLPDEVKQEFEDTYRAGIPHAQPAGGNQEAENWRYFKRSIEKIVDDSAT